MIAAQSSVAKTFAKRPIQANVQLYSRSRSCLKVACFSAPQPSKVTVVGICGSLREGGFTKKALEVAISGAESAHCNVELIDLNEYRLYFCDGSTQESKAAKLPNDADKLRAKVKAAQGLILATPEYHGSYSGVLKNALDLLSWDEMEGKVVGLVGVAGGALGGYAAMTHLREVCRSLHAWVVPEQAAVPQVWKNLEDADVQKRLVAVGKQVAKFSHLHNHDQAQEFLEEIEKAAENPGAQASAAAAVEKQAVSAAA